jgi:PAS domain S-box-containing protein
VAIGHELEPGGSTHAHEQELAALDRASEARYRQLADAMPQIVWTAGADGGATYFNRRWFEYTGLKPDETGPNAWQLVVHPDDLANAVAIREATLQSGETFEVEYRFRASDGSYRWHLGRAVPMHDDAGRIEFWIGTATDIHDRKVIEDQLAEELARRATTAIENATLYRQAEERALAARALATIGDGVFLVDRGGRIRLWNGAAERITGVTEADAVGHQAAEAIPGWAAIEPRVPVSHAGEPAQAESVPIELGDRELWLSFSAVGYEDETVYAFRDLTEERALESMRQEIVATVSHELRTPLAAIYGAALTLRRGDVELGTQLRNKLLEIVAEESSRLSEIVNDLLLASQLDSGKLRVNIEQCDPRKIAGAEIDSARTHLPENVEIVLKTPRSLPSVAVDAGQLRQVIANLIDNAVKYSPQGGRVSVTLAARDHHVRFAVKDTGLGVPAAEQGRIFEKFYRLDPHLEGGIGGTGLGLYICRELVRRVNGQIWVESDAGKGSTFFVEVPQQQGAAAGSNA